MAGDGRLENVEHDSSVMEREANYGDDLKRRTKSFALGAIRLYVSLPRDAVSQHLGRQAMRSGTSVGAHYSEACRARSTAEFVSKVEVGIQELEETCYWLDLLEESGTVKPRTTHDLCEAARELNRILTASVKTAKSRK
jgi:four helix bundle protein